MPREGEVVVELVAAALNRRDLWLWRGSGTRVPVTLGSDGAGPVALVGEGVPGISPGDEVVINPALGWGDDEGSASAVFAILGSPTDGTFAQRVVVPAANVQIAHALGAEVWVTSGDDAKIARCIELGARGGFRYDDPEWPGQVLAATAGAGVHAVVDSFGGDGWAKALDALARGGVLVNYGDTGGDEATIPVAALYWQWRSLVGTTMGSPSEFRALCDHLAEATWRARDRLRAPARGHRRGCRSADRGVALRQGRHSHHLGRLRLDRRAEASHARGGAAASVGAGQGAGRIRYPCL